MSKTITKMKKTFSQLSPQKQLFAYQEFTPAKVNVGCDINGWLQTHKKSASPLKRRKFKSHPLPPKHQSLKLCDNVSLQKLKRRISKLNILQQMSNKRQKSLQSTNPGSTSQASSPLANKKYPMQPILKISEFSYDQSPTQYNRKPSLVKNHKFSLQIKQKQKENLIPHISRNYNHQQSSFANNLIVRKQLVSRSREILYDKNLQSHPFNRVKPIISKTKNHQQSSTSTVLASKT